MEHGNWCPMNISSLFSFSTSARQAQGNANAATSKSVQDLSPLALAVQRADQRIQAEVETNTAQLSSFGKLKSSVSDVQLAARSLTELSVTASSPDITSAVNTFVSAFNTLASAAKNTIELTGAVQTSQNASQVAKGLQQAMLPDPASSDALKSIGVHLQDGRLALLGDQFESARAADPAKVLATLYQLGQRVDKSAGTELEANGNVSGYLTTLRQHAKVLGTQQSALQSAAVATANSAGQSANGAPGRGLAAYQSHINIG